MATIEPEPPFSKSKSMELPRSVVIGQDTYGDVAATQVMDIVKKYE